MLDPIDPFMPALDLAAAIRRRQVSPVEVVDMYLERMDELDPRLNAFCHRADDDVRKAARAAADAVVKASAPEDLPPFLGVPLPVKDLVDAGGWPTTHGSAGAGHVGDHDAGVTGARSAAEHGRGPRSLRELHRSA